MTREEFDGLVRRVEERYAGRPAALRWRVAALALAGYAGLLAWLGIIVLISAGFYALMMAVDLQGKIIFGFAGSAVLFGGGWAVLRALLVRVPKPEGRPATRAQAPELFAVLDDLRARLSSPPFHQVLIEPVCNAAVVQVPRLGVFGWHRNYLLIGLPLLDGLSREQMRAVLAHEFAHLSREHGRLSHRLYRLRRSWDELFRRLAAPRVRGEFSMRPLVSKFVRVFWPHFNAHAFVLSRQNEYEADADAARVAGKTNAASALVRLNTISRQLEQKLWPAVFELANEQLLPPDDVFARLRDGIRAGPSGDGAAKWLDEGLRMTSTNSDTHPCLTERLRALDTPPPPRPSAAEALFGASLEAVRADVQKLWSREMASKWRDRHARAAALKNRLNSLEAAAAGPAAEAERLWDKAVVLLDLEGGKAARPLLQRLLALRPDYAPARLQLGRLLLADDPAEGVAHLRRAMELDEHCAPQACSLLHRHYRLRGESGELRAIEARMDLHDKAHAASQAKRREVNVRDRFVPHGLGAEELRSVREALAAEARVLRAHLAQKSLAHFPAQRLFVLCVYPRRPWHGFADHAADRELVNRLSRTLRLPGRLMVFSAAGSFRALSRKLAGVADVEIFRRID